LPSGLLNSPIQLFTRLNVEKNRVFRLFLAFFVCIPSNLTVFDQNQSPIKSIVYAAIREYSGSLK
jgi:hypothetical protein